MPKYTVADIVHNAVGENPVELQKALSDVLMGKVQDAVLAKREDMINNYYSAPEDELEDDEVDGPEDEVEDDDEEEEIELDDEDFEEELDDEDYSDEETEDEENQ